MDPNEQNLYTWNKVAALYREKFMDQDIYNESYDLICSSIQKTGARILEIGCGPGNITRYLLTKRPDFSIHGIDMAEAMIELARQANPAATFSVMDARQISALEPGYDGIVIGFCLPYLSASECLTLFSDCSRLLNPGGLLYLSFVEGDPARSGYLTGSTGDTTYFYYHRLADLRAQLIENGFREKAVMKVEERGEEEVVWVGFIGTVGQ